MNEEIKEGIRNAIEHGASLEQAVHSFVNAGYSMQEVQEAANSFSYGASSLIHETKAISPVSASVPIAPPVRNIASLIYQPQEKQKKGKKAIIILIIVLILLLGGLLLSIVFKDKVLGIIG